ncbi:ribosome-recycling factor [Neofusicoccum ribis]|uniref:Ribosome-recycling factor n=1 Tax=Neofusicoccum ribis TaxID=45134 RepID=A0ABR3SSZ6_9PEZI
MATPTDDAYDLSTMESQILKAMERLTHELSELRAGGRFNTEHLEKLKVTLKPSGSALGEKETHRLGDLAQVIPKGRVVTVIAGDEDYVKPLMTAIQASPYSLTPQQPKPDSPTTIAVPIPPPTGESRKKALEAAKKAETNALQAVQTARAAHQKKLRALEVGKKVRPDDASKAKKLMDETAKKGQEEVKHIVDGARKVLESQ